MSRLPECHSAKPYAAARTASTPACASPRAIAGGRFTGPSVYASSGPSPRPRREASAMATARGSSAQASKIGRFLMAACRARRLAPPRMELVETSPARFAWLAAGCSPSRTSSRRDRPRPARGLDTHGSCAIHIALAPIRAPRSARRWPRSCGRGCEPRERRAGWRRGRR